LNKASERVQATMMTTEKGPTEVTKNYDLHHHHHVNFVLIISDDLLLLQLLV